MECMLNRRIISAQGNDASNTSKITLTSNLPEEYGGFGIYAVNPNTKSYTEHILSAPGKLTVTCVGKLPFVIYGLSPEGWLMSVDFTFFDFENLYLSEFDTVFWGFNDGYKTHLPEAIQDFFAPSTSQVFVFPAGIKDYNFIYNFET